MLDAVSPSLAVGMVSTAGALGHRQRVRETVFHTLVAAEVAWRFIVGANGGGRVRDEPPDVLAWSADGAAHSKQCSCSEKTRWWFGFAIRRWPNASWVAKTEDDTYLHLGKLLFDLSRSELRSQPFTMFGLMNLCTCQSAGPRDARASGCFLGDMEHADDVERALKKHRRMLGGCRSQVPTPFPTGPLAVLSAPLVRQVFEQCEYLRAYSREAAALQQPTSTAGDTAEQVAAGGCLTRLVRQTFLERNACDCSVGHWVQRCVRGNVTLASMTWTRGHHWAHGAGGMGYVRADAQSVAVHHLKTSAVAPWHQTHNASNANETTAFPPLMWQWSNPSTGATFVRDKPPRLTPMQPALQRWYTRVCRGSPSPEALASYRRLANASHAKPQTWRGFGCHQARHSPWPTYPGSPQTPPDRSERRARL